MVLNEYRIPKNNISPLFYASSLVTKYFCKKERNEEDR